MKVVVSVYADTVYSDWWDNPEYGDDNTAYLSLDKADLIEWLNITGDDFDTFMSEYTHDWTNDLVAWLKENNKHFEVLE